MFGMSSCGEETKTEKSSTPPVNVKVEKPKGNLPQHLNYKGKVQSSQSVNIQSRGSSYIEDILVDVGEEVSENQMLVKLNSDDLNSKQAQLTARLEEVEALLKDSERDFKRYQNLREKNSVSEKELESVQLKYNSVKSQKAAIESQIQELESELKYFNIKAPFDGIITSKLAHEGDLANPQSPILQMETEEAFEFQFSVSERDISKLRKGQLAKVKVIENQEELDAQLSEISSSSQHSGGQFLVKASLLDVGNFNLFSGQQAEIEIVTNELEKGIFVPESALIRRGSLQGIYVLSAENKAMLRWVEVGESYEAYVEILSGLNSDERFITSSDSKLYNGINVNY